MPKTLFEAPPVQLCVQCQHSCSTAPHIRKAASYLKEHAANHIPLDHELPYLRGSFQETLVEIDRWNSELERLRDVVRQIEERRECLLEIAYRLNGMVKATIRRLPSELLLRIFFMARDEGNEGRSTCRVPLTLSHVCGRWRALIHSEPGLWCIIDAKVYIEDDEVSANRLLEFTKFCLEKSQSRPLNVTLTTPEDLYDSKDELEFEYKDLHAKVLNELLANSCRWKVANFVLRPYDGERFADHVMEFPVLERLDMCFQQDEGGPYDAITSTCSAPRLSHLRLRGVGRNFLKLINLDALTELTMEDYRIEGLLHILLHSPSLSDVTLKGSMYLVHQESNLHVTSQIKSLHAELQDGNHDVFEHLSLPSLTKLWVRCNWYHGPPLQLHRLISRSRPPLTHLHLSNVPLPYVMDTLAMLPTITHFTLKRARETGIMDSFLRRMTVRPESTDSVLLPNLLNLGLHFNLQMKKGQIQNILNMVESRCRVTPGGNRQRLVFLRVTFLGQYESEMRLVRQRMDVLRDNGLDVQYVI
ncbi:hypothetical protein Moror_2493 [Moniliophthora roreri MCA 2997]|uniref:Uncharacterized protein n=1 Tax=Moniliophthora roreri (strain MCA 2997) TaxID=1381753 RepID=V2Y261_MONRO|nr:hypothetical protein Moror_2493 [Moniliophthora roreri MCA 2997]